MQAKLTNEDVTFIDHVLLHAGRIIYAFDATAEPIFIESYMVYDDDADYGFRYADGVECNEATGFLSKVLTAYWQKPTMPALDVRTIWYQVHGWDVKALNE